ncbi:surface lipoprotein-related protein [Staphylococcus lugdunensis]|nr:surface lipoprotein-related protein [Staphylococcus lugdunensis]
MGENTKKWYKSNWFTLLCLVFVFPIGLFLMWKFTNWKTWVKVVVSVFFCNNSYSKYGKQSRI